MSIKKKLGLGVASAALGISLVGGGTFAAFNDVETLNASYAAGKLDLEVNDTTSTGVKLSNLKPGDVFEKAFKLDAIGSLAIKDVLLQVKAKDFVDYEGEDNPEDTDIYGKNSANQFLSQFTITVASIGTEGGNGYQKDIIKDVNLLDFIKMTDGGDVPSGEGVSVDSDYYDSESGRINVVTKTGPDGEYHGLPVDPDDLDEVLFTIKFDNHDKKDANGVQVQNKYQGDSVTLDFIFEARQWDGLTIEKEHVDGNGYIKANELSNSEDGGEVVEPEEPPVDPEPEPQPEPETTYEVQVKNFDYEYHLFKGHWDLDVKAEFEFVRDGKVVGNKTVSKTEHNVNRKVENRVEMSVNFEGEKYTETVTVPKDNGWWPLDEQK